MTDPVRRRFTMLDAILLIAATAVGLAPLRSVLAAPAFTSSDWPIPVRTCVRFATLAGPCMLSWMAVVAVASLVRSRPDRHLLGRRPGVVAAIVGSSWGILALVYSHIYDRHRDGSGLHFGSYDFRFWLEIPSTITPVVIGAWATLMLGGSWEPDASWTDRAGRWLGSYWIVIYFLLRMFNFFI